MCVFALSFTCQFLEHRVQLSIGNVKAGYSIHQLLIGPTLSRGLQLVCQFCQFLDMGIVMGDHILHQRQQLLHWGRIVIMAMAAMAVDHAFPSDSGYLITSVIGNDHIYIKVGFHQRRQFFLVLKVDGYLAYSAGMIAG